LPNILKKQNSDKEYMELIWTKEFKESNFIGYHCECKPFVLHNKLFYAFKSIDRNNKTINGVNGVKMGHV
jgi:hypothetical protein